MRYLTPLGKVLYPALYPIRGIWFFIVHPPFWSLFKTRLIPVLFLSLLVYTLLFMFAFLPQAALLAIFHGPAAFVSAAFLVLGEGELAVFIFQSSRLQPPFMKTPRKDEVQELIPNRRRHRRPPLRSILR